MPSWQNWDSGNVGNPSVPGDNPAWWNNQNNTGGGGSQPQVPIPGSTPIPPPPSFGPPPTPPPMPGYGNFSNPNPANLALYSKMPGQSTTALNNVSSLARLLEGGGSNLYNVGLPAYTAAANYYSQLLGGNGAAVNRAVGPQAEAISNTGAGTRNAILSSNLRGGARDQALAQASLGTGQALSDLVPKAMESVVPAAASTGLSGATAGAAMGSQGAGLMGTVAGAYQQQGQFGAGTELQNRLGGAGLGIQGALGLGNLNLQSFLGKAGLDLQSWALPIQFGQSQQGLDIQKGLAQLQETLGPQYLAIMQQQLAAQQQSSKWGSLGGALGFAAPFLAGLGNGPSGPNYADLGSGAVGSAGAGAIGNV